MSDPLKCLWLSYSTAYNWSCLLCFVPKIPRLFRSVFRQQEPSLLVSQILLQRTCHCHSPVATLKSPTCDFQQPSLCWNRNSFMFFVSVAPKRFVIWWYSWCSCVFFWCMCVCDAVKMKIITYCICTVRWSKSLFYQGLGICFCLNKQTL